MKIERPYAATAKLWVYPGEHANWYFLTLPKTIGQAIKTTYAPMRRGFGSLPVTVTIGATTWDTSIFPDSHSGSYLLPVKARVRSKEELLANDEVSFTLEIRH